MKVLSFLVVPVLAIASMAQAQMSPDMKAPMPMKSASAVAGSFVMTEGVVQSVNAARGTITLKHGNIINLKMPAMTMTFGVADKKMLGHVVAGDKVKFHAEMLKNGPTVTRIEPSR